MNSKLYDIIFVLMIFVAIGIMITLASKAYANPYITGYGFNGTKIYHANTSWFLTQFKKPGTSNPNQPVLSVLTEEGSNSSSGSHGVTGAFYQTVSYWNNTDQHIWVADQVWVPPVKPNIYIWKHEINACLQCTQGNLNRISGNPVWSTDQSKVTFIHTYIFNNGTAFSIPSGTYTKNMAQDSSKYFLVGQCSGSGCYLNMGSHTIEFFQFAVESDPTSTNNFDVKQYLIQFNDGYDYSPNNKQISLASMNATLLQQTDAFVGWYTNSSGTFTEYPGDTNYNGVWGYAKDTRGGLVAGAVWWNYTSCSPCQSSFTSLW
jgi:hypothetical protein